MTYRPSIRSRMKNLFLDLFYFLRVDSFFLNYFFPLLYYAMAIGAIVLLCYKGDSKSLNSTDDLDPEYIFIGMCIVVLFFALLAVLIIFTPCEATCKIGEILMMKFENCWASFYEKKIAEDDAAGPLLETEDLDDDDRFDEKDVLIV